MRRNGDNFDISRQVCGALDWLPVPPVQPQRGRSRDDDSDLNAIVHSEGWHVPPPEVTRVALRPWQQAVFWGLRLYIVVMLAVMVVGFTRVAVGQ
jgi:hypothetical protein